MIINILGENVVIKDVPQDVAYYIFKKQFTKNQKALDYYSKNTRMYYEPENKKIPYILNGGQTIKDYEYDNRIYFPVKYVQLQEHLMKHQKYGAFMSSVGLHLLEHGGANRAMDKIISIEDDKELSIISSYLMNLSAYGMVNGDCGLNKREPVLERIIEYLKRGYEIPELREQIEDVLKINNNGASNKTDFSIALNKMIQDLFIKYDDTFNFLDFSYYQDQDVFLSYPRNKDAYIENYKIKHLEKYDLASWTEETLKKYYKLV